MMMTDAAAESDSALIFLQGRSPEDHPGIVDGYMRLQKAGRIAHLDIMPVFGPDGVVRGEPFWNEAIARATAHQTSIVVFQYYHSDRLPDPRPAIAALKALPSSPFVVVTLGDPFMNGYRQRPKVPRSFLQAAAGSDLVTLTSMGALGAHVARYTRAPIILDPHAACQVRFCASQPCISAAPPEFDVVFIGSYNAGKNFLRPYYRFGQQRHRLLKGLARRFGKRFAVFGNGWDGVPGNQGPTTFDEQAATAARARIVVGGVPYSRARYYTSNRPFIQMTSGTPMVDTSVPGVDKLLRPTEHWVLADDDGLIDAVERTLELPDDERARIGEAAKTWVLARHTQAHRNVSTYSQHIGDDFYVTTSGSSMLAGVGETLNASGVPSNSAAV